MSDVAVALFTRDLRVHDNPMLAAAAEAGRVVPLFVLDERLLASAYNRPNRAKFLAESLADLDTALKKAGADGLVVRRGDPAAEVRAVAAEVRAREVHVSGDVSAFARRREESLRKALAGLDGPGRGGGGDHRAGIDAAPELHVHDDVVTVVPPGALRPSGGDHFAVFSPYHRRWSEQPVRPLVDPPSALRSARIAKGRLPTQADIAPGDTSPDLARGGEAEGRRIAAAFTRGPVRDYGGGKGHDDLANEGTSRLSPYLHFGCVSATELTRKAGRGEGAQAFVRQLAWRDFYAQLLAARRAVTREDYHPRGDRWRTGKQAERDLEAWKQGRTGYPVIDAGMRQLRREGWMHNRARLLTGSFLTKTLYLDWRLGAQHFVDLLVDGDTASNTMNWQWIAGTGTDTRPSRVLNPLLQAERYDSDGVYVRRYVEELAAVDPVLGGAVHTPWKLPDDVREGLDYPAPIVDLAEGRQRFLDARKG